MKNRAEYSVIDFLSIAVIFIYPFLFIRHGIDFTDFGFLLTNYSFIFDSPANVQYGFGYWLTYVIGGLLLKISVPYGALIIRIAYAVITVLTGYLSYRVLRKLVPRKVVLPFIALTILYITNAMVETWLSYNNLTSVINVSIALFLLSSMKREWLKYLVVGLLVGISVFVRFPNIVMVILPVFFLLYEKFYEEKTWIVIAKDLLFYISGILTTFFIMYLTLHMLGHLEFYLNALNGLKYAVGEKGTSTSGSSLIGVFLFGNIKILLKAIFLFIWMYVLFKSFNISRLKKIKSIFVFLKVAGVGLVLLYVFKLEWSWLNLVLVFLLPLLARSLQLIEDRKLLNILSVLLLSSALIIGVRFAQESSSWKLLPVLYAALIYKSTVLIYHRDVNLKYYLVALALLLFTPFGSSLGLYNSYLGMWLALPLTMWVIYDEIRHLEVKWTENTAYVKRTFFIFLVLFFTIASVGHDFLHTWRDAPKMELNTEINKGNLKGLLTRESLAVQTIELLEEMEKLLEEDQLVLAYNELPLLHYMTNTKPFLNNPWPQLFSPGYMEAILDSSFSEVDKYPLIVRKKGIEEWPTDGKIGTISIMDDYFFQLGYMTVWENERYVIRKK